MMIVAQGSEYFGETYIYCPQCFKWAWSDSYRMWIEDEHTSNHKFTGDSIEELEKWISVHRNHDGPGPIRPTIPPKGK